ncbi:uncharacterized protein si:ch73-112l6.1 isoform X1 [Myxocyprinus asiaticus]|uniref:uncharacterized protein si:ch73-112l6.1 isoform X1 n=1 Tax=Myxocyprinus asiaticus TaxID=70543 RepID=UPI0022216457|nr:uncharacterized protein si:ch73-112l6.1 isoform X1 [Myxocyprinus asiaticus]
MDVTEFDIEWRERESHPHAEAVSACASRSSLQKTPQRSSHMAALENQPSQKLSDLTEELLLPEGWKQTLPKEQHLWVSKALFTRDASGKLTLTEPLQLWWSPPGPQMLYSQPPLSPDPFFHSRLFLWMPYHMWGYRLLCTKPNCRRLGNHLTACGLYKTVRRVLDLSGWYFMVTEYLECCSCKKKVAGWSQDIMDQLDPIHCEKFPAILTYRLSCDKEIVRLMRGQTPGNSATTLYRHLRVRHKEQWLVQSAEYFSVLNKFQDPSTLTARLPQMMPLPSPSLLLSVYVKDVLARLGEMKARVTSIYGSILKMAYTKKVTQKHAADSAVWTISMGNEVGQVLMCVLTQAEGEGLLPMCSGLMERYRRAGEAPPKVLYVDRECCATLGKGKAAAMFHEWDQLVVRLDVYHFIHQFAAGITSENHTLYSVFMGRLFSCIFEWDAADLERLLESKQSELRQSAGFLTRAPSKPTAKELARHCRHYTRGAHVTEQLIEQLLKDFMEATDMMGIRLVDQERMMEIWRTQRCHLSCIQDPPDVQLYRKVGEVTRGGVNLPVYNCARDFASIDSFHWHLNHFIPVTCSKDLHFHVYLLEGLVQWNEARAEGGNGQGIYYGSQLQQYVNRLSQMFLGCKLDEDHTNSGKYTGELIGVEYLYSQTNRVLEVDDIMDPDTPDENGSDEDLEGDLEHERFEDLHFDGLEPFEFLEFSLNPPQPVQHQAVVVQMPFSSPSTFQPDPIVSSTSGPLKDERTTADTFTPQGMSQEDDDENCLGPDDIPGYDHVINLANSLVDLRNQGFVKQRKVDEIVTLWDKLSEQDKGNIPYPGRHEDRLHFVTPCIDGLKSRLVEAICLALSRIHPAGQTIAGVRVNRWAAILRDYCMIRDIVLDNTVITARTRIQLFDVNQRTLCQWYNTRRHRQEQMVLNKCIDHMRAPLEASAPLPPVLEPLHHGPVIKVEVDASGLDTCVQGHPLPVQGSPKPSYAALLLSPQEQRTADTTPPSPKVPRTTAWRRRKAEEEAAQRGLPIKRPCEQYVCKKCGKPKTKEFGHSQFRGVHFCAKAAGKTVEQWMEEMRSGQGSVTQHVNVSL